MLDKKYSHNLSERQMYLLNWMNVIVLYKSKILLASEDSDFTRDDMEKFLHVISNQLREMMIESENVAKIILQKVAIDDRMKKSQNLKRL